MATMQQRCRSGRLYEEVLVTHAVNSPMLRRSFSAESVEDVSSFQEPMMEVEAEFGPTSADHYENPRQGQIQEFA